MEFECKPFWDIFYTYYGACLRYVYSCLIHDSSITRGKVVKPIYLLYEDQYLIIPHKPFWSIEYKEVRAWENAWKPQRVTKRTVGKFYGISEGQSTFGGIFWGYSHSVEFLEPPRVKVASFKHYLQLKEIGLKLSKPWVFEWIWLCVSVVLQ